MIFIHRYMKLFALGLLMFLAVTSASTLAYMSTRTNGVTLASNTISGQAEQRENKAERRRAHHIRPHSSLTKPFKAMGGAVGLYKSGAQRLTLNATLTDRSGQSSPITIDREHANQLHVFDRNGRGHATRFDALENQSLEGLELNDQDLIETLLFDSAEHFFASQMRGASLLRLLGTRFKPDSSLTEDYKGPYYDIYHVIEQNSGNAQNARQSKFYDFNSDTHLLERVRYRKTLHGVTKEIEVHISGWHKQQERQVPGHIVRLEDGQPVLTLKINSLPSVAGPTAVTSTDEIGN